MSKSPGLPGRWIWVLLVLVLAALTLLRVVTENHDLRLGLGEAFVTNVRSFVGLIVALAIALLALVAPAAEESGSQRALDRAFLVLVITWVISSASVVAVSLTSAEPAAVLLRNLAYQLSLAASLNFLRATVSQRTPLVRALQLGQLLIASGCLVWAHAIHPAQDWPITAWRTTNVVACTAIFLALCRSLLADTRYPPWLSLGACLMGFGIGLSDMVSANGTAVAVTVLHNVYSAYLMMVWLLLTNRLGRLYAVRIDRPPHSEHSILGDAFANTDLTGLPGAPPEPIAPVELPQAPPPAGATAARRRIAQELHDGVGSQLVNLLASLDRREPHQRAMAEGLEQCLLDIKILVDDIDATQECVLDALARLRYRVQSSLDRLGIRLHWDLRDEVPLSVICDERSRQVLRVAQESLANVMRHARAKNVTVSCRYAPEADALVLDIADDGVGFDTRQSFSQGGKGLQGMRRRAEGMQADLLVRSFPGTGTTVRLLLPLAVSAPAPVRKPSGTGAVTS